MIKISGVKGTTRRFSGSREHKLKTFLGTRDFVNRVQGIKSKNDNEECLKYMNQ